MSPAASVLLRPIKERTGRLGAGNGSFIDVSFFYCLLNLLCLVRSFVVLSPPLIRVSTRRLPVSGSFNDDATLCLHQSLGSNPFW